MPHSPSSAPESPLEGLSEAQLKLMDELKKAGPTGIYWTKLFEIAEAMGVDPADYDELKARKLIISKPGNIQVHVDFSQ